MKRLILGLLLVLFGCNLHANNLNNIRQLRVLRVGVLPSSPPFGQINEYGDASGFEVDLARQIADEIFRGERHWIEFIATLPEQRTMHLQDNKVDIVLALFEQTDEARAKVDFSTPYMVQNLAFLVRSSEDITSTDELKNKRVAVRAGSFAERFALANVVKSQIVYVNDARECYNSVKNGSAEVCIDRNMALIGFPRADDSVMLASRSAGPYQLIAAGVSKGNKELKEIINNAFLRLGKDGYFKKAEETTFRGAGANKFFLLDEHYMFINGGKHEEPKAAK